MKRLGYKRYVSQGGDWGAVVADAMGRQAPPGLLGIHVNMPATVPPEIAKALTAGEPAPAGLSDEEKAAYERDARLYKKGCGYAADDGDPAADARVQPRGFASRPGCVVLRQVRRLDVQRR